jgi:hypothetical protein
MTNRPCRFKPLAERNGNQPLEITVKRFPALQEVRLISPDTKEITKLQFKKITQDSWAITIPTELVKRYTVIVCDPGKK